MQRLLACIIFTAVIAGMPLTTLARTPNDELYGDQWYLERISAPAVWEQTTGSRDVIIAVLDSGVDLLHEDLLDNLWENPKDEFGDGIDNDGNGYIDDSWGYDFVLDEGNPFPVVAAAEVNPTSTLHGTLVSGVIGAMGNNSLGVAGVAWTVQILPVRVLDELGNGNGGDIARGIRYAVDQGASVINLSFSGSVDDERINEALRYARERDVVVVSAVGNEGLNVASAPAYPACAPHEIEEDLVIGVAASDELDEKADFSNYGKDCIDITAPGTEFTGIAYYNPDYGYDDLYTEGWSGTSLAAPVVSGSIGLILAHYPGFSPEQIKTILQLSADPILGEYRADMGAGRLNVERAFEVAGRMWEQVESESLGKLDFVRIPTSSTVYLLMEDGSRRMVLDTNTFFTYADSFAGVRMISEESLAAYKLRGVVLPRANRVLVKIQSDPKVYWLSQNSLDLFTPNLREIPDEATAIALFGPHWSDHVVDIDVTMFQKFTVGAPVEVGERLRTMDLIKRVDLN